MAKRYYLFGHEGGPGADAFISLWDTRNTSTGSSNSDQIAIPTTATGSYACTIDWGDSSTSAITAYNDAALTHTYTTAGEYTIIITGTFEGFQFDNTNDRLKVLNISQFGTLRISDGVIGKNYFYGCENVTCTATDVMDLSNADSILNGWRDCANWSYDYTGCDVSMIQSAASAFLASGQTDPLPTSWPSLTTTFLMFAFSDFNGPVSITAPNLTTAQGMFQSSAMDSNVTLTALILSSVRAMFQSSPMSANVTITSNNLSNAREMFNACFPMNGTLTIPTSNITTVFRFFQNADAWRQSLASWTVPQITDFGSFMALATGMDSTDYGETLVSWAAQGFHASARSISFGGSKYDSGDAAVVAARAVLVAHFTTLFEDGGPV